MRGPVPVPVPVKEEQMKLKDRVAIVTGGSSGIGRGVCLEFAREGARVVVADLQEAPKRGRYHDRDVTTPTTREIQNIGGQARFVQTDVADEGAVRALVETAVMAFGGLDIVVNNAGIFIFADSQALSVADWDRIVGVNLRSVFLLTKFAIPHLLRSRAGRIINIASVHAFGGGGGPAHAPTKGRLVKPSRQPAPPISPPVL